MEFSKTNEFTQNTCILLGKNLTTCNQKSLTSMGNKLVIASGIMSFSAIYGMLHSCWAITNNTFIVCAQTVSSGIN